MNNYKADREAVEKKAKKQVLKKKIKKAVLIAGGIGLSVGAAVAAPTVTRKLNSLYRKITKKRRLADLDKEIENSGPEIKRKNH